MNKGFNNIELTEEEIQSLDNPDQESTASQEENADNISADTVAVETVEDTETKAPEIIEGETEVEVEDSFDGLEIDGERIDREAILAWREDSSNKSEWQKSNTEKAQNLSKWNKLSEKINEDENFRSHLKDYFFDNPEAVKSLGLDGDIPSLEKEEAAPIKDAELSPVLEQRLEALEKVEGERLMEHRVDLLDEELVKLEETYPEYLEGPKVSQFLEFADKNADRFVENGMPSLDRAFREWSYGEMQAELKHYKQLNKNGKRNEGKVIGTAQVGAKEVKSPKKYTNWKDISMDDPEIAEYFDK